MARDFNFYIANNSPRRVQTIHAYDAIGNARRVTRGYVYDENGNLRQFFPGLIQRDVGLNTSVNVALNPNVFAGFVQFQLLAASFAGPSSGFNDTQTPSGTLTPSPVSVFGGRIASLVVSSTGIVFTARNCPSDPGESALKAVQTSLWQKTVGGADYSGYFFSLGNIARWDWNNYVTPFALFTPGQSYTVTLK